MSSLVTWEALAKSIGLPDFLVVVASIDYVQKVMLSTPLVAIGLTNADIIDMKDIGKEQGFGKVAILRFVEGANAVHQLSRKGEVDSFVMVVGHPLVIVVSKGMTDVIGNDIASASLVAKALKASSLVVEVNEILSRELKNPFTAMRFEFKCDMVVFQVMEQARVDADAIGKEAHSKLDLASKVVRPDWMPPEAVNGTVVFPGMDEAYNPEVSTQAVAHLAKSFERRYGKAPLFHQHLGLVSLFLEMGPCGGCHETPHHRGDCVPLPQCHVCRSGSNS